MTQELSPDLKKAVRDVQTAHARKATKRALMTVGMHLEHCDEVMDVIKGRGCLQVAMADGVVLRVVPA